VIDNAVVKRSPTAHKTKTGRKRGRKLQHLCLDKGYNSEHEEQELIKRGYVLHVPPKRKRDEEEIKVTIHYCSNRKTYSAKRLVIERTNS
jgi:hypothetical protein